MNKNIIKVKIQYPQTLDGKTHGTAICPFCKYMCYTELWDNGKYPSIMDDVCVHFDHIETDEDCVVFKKRGAFASKLTDPFSARY